MSKKAKKRPNKQAPKPLPDAPEHPEPLTPEVRIQAYWKGERKKLRPEQLQELSPGEREAFIAQGLLTLAGLLDVEPPVLSMVAMHISETFKAETFGRLAWRASQLERAVSVLLDPNATTEPAAEPGS